MAQEIETKVLDINPAEIQEKLTALGASKLQETRLAVDWFHPIGTEEGKDEWFLRIRSNSAGKHEVTWKAVLAVEGIARTCKEINFMIEEPEKLADLFAELGLEKYGHQEKDRISYALRDWRFDLDHYPGMPPYLEIEGTSEAHIKEAMKLLGVENNPTWARGERTLIQEKFNLDWYDMRF